MRLAPIAGALHRHRGIILRLKPVNSRLQTCFLCYDAGTPSRVAPYTAQAHVGICPEVEHRNSAFAARYPMARIRGGRDGTGSGPAL